MAETLENIRAEVGFAAIIGAVYGFTVFGSDEIRYVGQTTASVRRRTVQHYRVARQGRKTPFYDWLRKTSESEVFAKPLEVVTTSLSDLGAAEQKWIAKLRKEGHRLLNLTDGGIGPTGQVWTVEQREAARIRSTGRPGVHRFGPESPMFGRSHTDEQKARWSEMRRGTGVGAANPNFGKYGPAHPAYGRVVSPETKALLSESKRGELNPNYGKSASAETRAKMSEVRKGRPMPSSIRSAHTRYHTNKGVFSDTCKHCIDDRNNERDST